MSNKYCEKDIKIKEVYLMDNYKENWNNMHKAFSENPNNIMKYDDWLNQFENIIDNVKGEIIDLGCGVTGNNTLYLMEHKKEVISCDFAEEALKVIKKHIPNSKTLCFDMTEKFPFDADYTQLVIADLSIHYFSKDVTKNIINEIKRVLKSNGYLIFRVNSVNSTEYKTVQGEKLEDKFYFTKGITKRFFDKIDIEEFFYEWDIEYINEENMNRWSEDKIIWKCLVKNK